MSCPFAEAISILPQSCLFVKASLGPIPPYRGFKRDVELAASFKSYGYFQQVQCAGEKLVQAVIRELEEDGVVNRKKQLRLGHPAPKLEPTAVELLPRV